MGNCKGKLSKESKNQMRGEAYKPSKPDTQGKETIHVEGKPVIKNDNNKDAVVINAKIPFVNPETPTKSESVIQGPNTSVSDTNGLKASGSTGKQDKKQQESDAIPEKPVEKQNKDVLSSANIKNNIGEETHLKEAPQINISLNKVPGTKSEDAEDDHSYLFAAGRKDEEPHIEITKTGQSDDSAHKVFAAGRKDKETQIEITKTGQSDDSAHKVFAAGRKDEETQIEITKTGQSDDSAHKDEFQQTSIISALKMGILLAVSKSVGIFHGPKGMGTCWRVGEDKIITAAHVVNDNIWYKTLDGCCVDFNYVDKNKRSSNLNVFKVEPQVMYKNEVLDVAVLKLKREKNKNFPPPLELFESLDPEKDDDKVIYLIGHNKGDEKTFNFGIGLWTPTETKMKDMEKFCLEYGEPNGYIGLDRKDGLVIKCEFVHGAAGCPGVVIYNDKAYVVLVYLRGFPDFYFRRQFPERKRELFPKERLLQQGVNIGSVLKTMTENTVYLRLRNEIFPIEANLEQQASGQNQYAIGGASSFQNEKNLKGQETEKKSGKGTTCKEGHSETAIPDSAKYNRQPLYALSIDDRVDIAFPHMTPPVDDTDITLQHGHSQDITVPRNEQNVKQDEFQQTSIISAHKMEILLAVSKSVGIFHGPKSDGTCWRVGEDKIITAAHVVNVNIWNNKFDTEYEESLDECYVDFNYVDKNKRSSKDSDLNVFKIEPPVMYKNEVLDVAVLKLKREKNKNFPPPVELFVSLDPEKDDDKVIYLIGHNKSDEKTFNFGIGLWTPTETKMKGMEKFCEEYGKPNGYIGLDRKDRLVIKCEFVNGASGCPGVVIYKDKAYVVLVYVRGFPTFYYSTQFPERKREEFPKERLLQQGVNIGSVFKTMTTTHLGLRNEIFPIEANLEQQASRQNQYAIGGASSFQNEKNLKGQETEKKSGKGTTCTEGHSETAIPDSAKYNRQPSYALAIDNRVDIAFPHMKPPVDDTDITLQHGHSQNITVPRNEHNVKQEEWIGNDMQVFKEKQLKELDLSILSKAINISKANSVALQLGLSQSDFEIIKHDAQTDLCYRILYKWRNKTGSAATLEKLIGILFLAWECDSETVFTEQLKSAILRVMK